MLVTFLNLFYDNIGSGFTCSFEASKYKFKGNLKKLN